MTHVSPPPVVIEKRRCLISLPTLSNQDRELHKEAGLSFCKCAEGRILLVAAVAADYC